MNDFPELQAGDHLLYGWSDLFGLITGIKTWSRAVHVEVYIGSGQSLASRNGLGVARYPFRRAQLIAVLRPDRNLAIEAGLHWFYSKHPKIDGQQYDWLGLLCFTLAVRQGSPRKMFCSEFATRFDRACGFDAFHTDFDADHIAPGNFLMSPAFDRVWLADSLHP